MTETPATPESAPPKRSHWNLLGSTFGPFLGLAVVVALFGVADSMQAGGGKFLSVTNVRAISVQTATVAVAALGMTVIVISGGIDLSAGTCLALCATILAWSLKEDAAMILLHGESVAGAEQRLTDAQDRLQRIPRDIDREQRRKNADPDEITRLEKEQAELTANIPNLESRVEAAEKASPRITPYSPWIAVIACIGAGCLAGLLNGVLVSYLRVVPFIVTLGTMRLYLGLSKKVADETTVRPDIQTQIPEWLSNYLSLREETLWGFGFTIWGWEFRIDLPLGVWLIFLLAIILALVLRYTVFGRYVFALGSNEATARLCGINVEWNKIAVYVVAGLFFGIAGLYQFSILSVGNPTSGIGLELNVIAAVVIGGGSLNGGRGSVLGTLTGAAIMAVITSGCTQLGLKNPVQDMILGAIIVAAVAIDQLRQRRLAS